MRTLAFAAIATATLVVAVACDGGSNDASPSESRSTAVTASTPTTATSPASPTAVAPPPKPERPPPRRGPATSTCVDGWVRPVKTSPKYTSPLGVIRRTTGVRGPLVVTDMRYFTGPESPPSDKGYLLQIERWYVRLWARRDPAFQGRFLVEARRFGQGVAAVAPYDTRGFRSPDWTGFQFDSGDTGASAYPRLPGEWQGVPYDFVKGGEGLTFPGLPAAVAGCLDGT